MASDQPHAKRLRRLRTAAAVLLLIAMSFAFALAWIVWPAAVQAPARPVPLEEPNTQAKAILAIESAPEPPMARPPLKRITLTPEEELRGPELAYVDDPEDLHHVQLQRIAALSPEAEAGNVILSYANAVTMAGNSWTINPEDMRYLRLEGVSFHPYPGVENPHAFTGEETQGTALLPYEQEAVQLLKKGRGVVWSFQEYGLHAVGPLRNTGQCLRCHDQPENALLGAMSYVYKELADD